MTFDDTTIQFNTNFNSEQSWGWNMQLPLFNCSWNSMPLFNFDWNIPSFNLSSFNIWNSMPSFSFDQSIQWQNSCGNNWSSSFNFGDTFTSSSSYAVNCNYKIKGLDGYNSDKGQKLAKDALSHKIGFTHHCAQYVSDSLARVGLSNGQRGHAYQMSSILRNNSNFKEVSVSSVDYKHLPAGCILVYDKGSQGYSSEYGHVEISTGNGTNISDGITYNIKKPSAIFMPV